MNIYSWFTSKEKYNSGWYKCNITLVFPGQTFKCKSYPFYKPNRKGKPKAKRNKLFNNSMRSIYGRKWSKMKKILKNMTVVRLNDFSNVEDRRFLEFSLTHSAIVEFPSGELNVSHQQRH